MEKSDLCRQLFESFANGDEDRIRQLCSGKMQAIQNGGAPMNLETLLQFTFLVLKVVKNFRYEDAVRSATETGFVEEHRVCGRLPDGSFLNLFACVVGRVQDGKVVELREYFDSAAAANLAAALS